MQDTTDEEYEKMLEIINSESLRKEFIEWSVGSESDGDFKSDFIYALIIDHNSKSSFDFADIGHSSESIKHVVMIGCEKVIGFSWDLCIEKFQSLGPLSQHYIDEHTLPFARYLIAKEV